MRTTPRTSKPIKQEVRLATRDSAEPLVILAEVHCDAAGIPALALHRCQYGWDITHIRSGYRVERIVGTKSLALQAMEILLDPANADWNVGKFSGDTEPIFAATDVARRKVYALLYPDSAPLPAYRTPRERRADRERRARAAWEEFAARRASFVTWATPEIDYSALRGIGLRVRYAVVRRTPFSGLAWVRITAHDTGDLLSVSEMMSGGAFYDDDGHSGRPERSAVSWVTWAAHVQAGKEYEQYQKRVRWEGEARAARAVEWAAARETVLGTDNSGGSSVAE